MRYALEPGTLALAKSTSRNAKIGDAATTYAEQRSCPAACVFKDGGGCYAESGQVGKFVTDPLNAAAWDVDAGPVDVAISEAAAIDAMDVVAGRAMRLHTVGDCATDEAAIIVAAACARYRLRGGGPVWTYTHAWRDVERESWGCVSVLASCETPDDVFAARFRGYATAIVVGKFPGRKLYVQDWGRGAQDVAPGDTQRGTAAPSGAPLRVLPCPAQTTHGVVCSSCRLCFDPERLRRLGITIGFEVHGSAFSVKKARLALESPDDPVRRMTSRQLIPALVARIVRESGRSPSDGELARRLGLNASSVWEMRRRLREEGVEC